LAIPRLFAAVLSAHVQNVEGYHDPGRPRVVSTEPSHRRGKGAVEEPQVPFFFRSVFDLVLPSAMFALNFSPSISADVSAKPN
jgi:hypothetical protein